MAAIVEDKSKLAAPHWQKYFHMSEQSSRGMKNNIQTNKQTYMYDVHRIKFINPQHIPSMFTNILQNKIHFC